MSSVDMPLTEFSSLVLIESEMDAQRCFVALEEIREVQVRRGVVGWIGAENDEEIDFACFDIRNEILD